MNAMRRRLDRLVLVAKPARCRWHAGRCVKTELVGDGSHDPPIPDSPRYARCVAVRDMTALAEVATEVDAREFRVTVTRNGTRFIRAEPVVGELRRRPQPNRSWPATSQNVTKYCRPEVCPQCGWVVPIALERRYIIVTSENEEGVRFV